MHMINLSRIDLNLLDIADLRLDTADLAFLSACQTRLGAGQLPDEAVHTAAMQIRHGPAAAPDRCSSVSARSC